MVRSTTKLDSVGRRIALALDRDPRGTIGWLAGALHIARGTVQSRLEILFSPHISRPLSTTIRPEALARPVRAFVTVGVAQSAFTEATRAMSAIPEVLECVAVAGRDDLVCQVVAVDADDFYRIGQEILRCPGVLRTASTMVLKELIPYRMQPLLDERSDLTGEW